MAIETGGVPDGQDEAVRAETALPDGGSLGTDVPQKGIPTIGRSVALPMDEPTARASAAPRSKYSRISAVEEARLGATIKAVRDSAVEEATRVVDEAGDLKPSEKNALFKKEWTGRARADEGFKDARDTLAIGHRDLARAVAHNTSQGFDLETQQDARQAADEQLLNSAERFDPGTRSFATYANTSVRGAVLNELNGNQPVHLPDKYLSQRRRLIDVEDSLAQELGRMPTPGEIAAKHNTNLNKGEKKVDADHVAISLENPVDTRKYSTIIPDGGLDPRDEDMIDGDPDTSEEYLDPLLVETEPVGITPPIKEGDLVDPHTDVAETVAERLDMRALLDESGLSEEERSIIFEMFVQEHSPADVKRGHNLYRRKYNKVIDDINEKFHRL